MKKLVSFYDYCNDELVLILEVDGKNIEEINKKSHKILNESEYKEHQYHELELHSFTINN